MIEFIGRVRYTDEENVLTAGYVRYMEADRQAIAMGDVVLTDRATGSVIEGPVMNYYQASASREESLIQIASGRPHAILVSVAKTDSTRRDTTVVDSDRMDITGRSRFEGWGSVELTRSDMVGIGEEALYDREEGTLRLIREARLTSDDYVLAGDTVTGLTNEFDEIEELTALGMGRLDGRDVNVGAPRIRIFFVAGEVNRLVAVGLPPATGPESESLAGEEPRLDPRTQAVATSTDFQLMADSIDVLAPGQVLQQVISVGRARGERLGDDLADANVPTIAARDWMKGDTVIAIFVESPDEVAEAPDVAPDSAARNVQVERVIAVGIGERATSSYRVKDDENADAESGINYMLARRITIHMKAGNVAAVEADGEVQGMYLQPASRARRSAESGAGGEVVNR